MTTMMITTTDNQNGAIANFNHFDLVEKWIAFAQVKPSSVKSYRKGIRRLAEYVEGNGIANLSRENLVEYREMLAKKYSPSTANLYLTSAKLFLAFLQQEGILSVNPAEHLKGLKVIAGHKKDSLSVQDTRKILSTFNTSTLKGKRDKAMYALMTTAGLRTIEVARANVGDIVKRGGKFFLYVMGKGRNEKSESVLLADGVYQMIQDYLTARGNISDNSALFASVSRRNFGGRLTTTSISRIIKTAMRGAGYNSRRLTAHSLRHTAATTMLLNGAAIRQVQQVLRHRNIAVTEIYLHDLDRMSNHAESIAAAAFGI